MRSKQPELALLLTAQRARGSATLESEPALDGREEKEVLNVLRPGQKGGSSLLPLDPPAVTEAMLAGSTRGGGPPRLR